MGKVRTSWEQIKIYNLAESADLLLEIIQENRKTFMQAKD